MKRLLTCALACSALLLAACAPAPTQPQAVSAVTHLETQVVQVPVPVPCVASVPKPRLPLSTRRQLYGDGSGYQVVMRYDREISLRDSYEADLLAALQGCVSAANRLPGGPGK